LAGKKKAGPYEILAEEGEFEAVEAGRERGNKSFAREDGRGESAKRKCLLRDK